jgi:hypothetical protein
MMEYLMIVLGKSLVRVMQNELGLILHQAPFDLVWHLGQQASTLENVVNLTLWDVDLAWETH